MSMIGVLTTLAASVAALQPLPMKILIDYAFAHANPPAFLGGALTPLGLDSTPTVLVALSALLGVAVFAIQSAVDSSLTWAWSVAGQRMVYRLTNDLFRHLLRLTSLYHSRRPVGDAISRLTGDTWCVYTFVSGFVMGPIHQVLMLGSVGVAAFARERRLASTVILAAPLLAVSSLYFGTRLKERAKSARKVESGLLSFVQQTLTAIPVVQAFTAEARNRSRFGALAEEAIALSRKGALLTSSYGMVNGAITTLGAGIVLFFGGRRVLEGTMPLGTLVVFLAYMQTLHQSLEGLLKTYGGFKPLEASIDRVIETLQSGEIIADLPGAQPLPKLPRGTSGHVRFENVSFGYVSGRPVLSEIDLEVWPGEKVALVGQTGAGKSTIVSLIPRLLDPWSGTLYLDGKDIRTVPLDDVRSRISMLLQDTFLFPMSVMENISLGRPTASRDEVIAAAITANAHAFIQQLPQGYETVLGERGSTLSGGERQRIAIARALLKDAPVLILDEPTSSLDAQTEASLMDALDRLMTGRTAFIIAHRLSTVRRADRILVLEHGRIVESGTHASLLAARGAYFKYHAAQFPRPAREVLA